MLNLTLVHLGKKCQISKKCGLTWEKIFEVNCVANVKKRKEAEYLQMYKVKQPHSNKHHEDTSVHWAKKLIESDFSAVIFSDEYRAILERSSSNTLNKKTAFRGGVMIVASISSDKTGWM